MAVLQHLQRRGGVFRFRARIPLDLAALIERSEISRTLATCEFPEAKRRLANVWAAWERTAAIIRSKPGMRKDQIDELVRDFVTTELSDYGRLHTAAATTPTLQTRINHEDAQRTRLRKMIVSDLTKGRPFWTQADLEDFLERRGIVVDRDSPLHAELMRSLAHGWLDALNRIDGGDITPPPAIAAAPALSEPQRTAARRVRTITELIEPFMRHKQRSGIGASWITEIRTALAWFGEWFGPETDISSISKDDFIAFKDGLQELPANWAKKLKGMNIRQAAEHNRTAGLPLLEIEALKGKRFKPAIEFLEWTKGNGYITENPAEGVPFAVSRKVRKEKKRDEFEIEDLQRIFDAPVFRDAVSDKEWWTPGSHQIRDHRFWLPLLGAFTGGRRGELCPLRVSDIVERDGILCIYIRERFDEDGARVDSLKNVESWRLVPVHPELLKIGFAEFVAERRRSGKDRLFDCPERNNYDQFGKWFARFLKSIGVKTGRNCYHSFRHCMEQAMRENIDDFTARFRITGRTNRHSSEGYGKGFTVPILFDQISKVKYDGLDLSGLHRQNM